ncbi:glycohydrolase toxin TNT-related protein [Actinokineospora sp. 24-640]
MAGPTQLNPTEQDSLVKQIGLALLRAAPADWASVEVAFRAIGRYTEVRGQVSFTDERTAEVPIAPEVVGLFVRLRAGMYREGRGTWFNARYQLDRPAAYNLEYDRDEPRWQNPPPPPAFVDELRMFPREDENVPEWLTRRLSAMQPPFRTARIFDGLGPSGPVINRPPLEDEEREQVQRYLDAAPLALPARGYDIDHLDEERRQTVPVAFHTDGTWIWPAAVNFYLRTHGVTPDPDLVAHARRAEFRIGEVDEQARSAAAAFIAGPRRPSGPPPRPPQDAPDFAHPERVPTEEPNAPTFAHPERVPVSEPSPHDRPFTRDDPADPAHPSDGVASEGLSPPQDHRAADHTRSPGERPEPDAQRQAEPSGPESARSHDRARREQPETDFAHPGTGFNPPEDDHAPPAQPGAHFSRPETDHARQEAEGFNPPGDDDTRQATEQPGTAFTRPDADNAEQRAEPSGPEFTRPEADQARRETERSENGFAQPGTGFDAPGNDDTRQATEPGTGYARPEGDHSSEQSDHPGAGFNPPRGDDTRQEARHPGSGPAQPNTDFGDPQVDKIHQEAKVGTGFSLFAEPNADSDDLHGDNAHPATDQSATGFAHFTRPDTDFDAGQGDNAHHQAEQVGTDFSLFTQPNPNFGDPQEEARQGEAGFSHFAQPNVDSDDRHGDNVHAATEQSGTGFSHFAEPNASSNDRRGDDRPEAEQSGAGFAHFARPNGDFGDSQGNDAPQQAETDFTFTQPNAGSDGVHAAEGSGTGFADFAQPNAGSDDRPGDDARPATEQSGTGFADTAFGEPRGDHARQDADRFEADHLAAERSGTDFARSQDDHRDGERSGQPGTDFAESGNDYARTEADRQAEDHTRGDADHPEPDFAGPDAAHADGVVQPTMEYSDPDLGPNQPEEQSTEDGVRPVVAFDEPEERGTGRRAMAGLFDQPEYAEPFDAFNADADAPASRHAISDEPNVPDPVTADAPLPPADVVSRLRRRLGEVGVPEDRYTVGTPTGPGWTMEQTGGGWRVGWFDGHYVAPAVFADVADAAAFLAGKVLLADPAPPARDSGPPTIRASLAQLEDDDDDEYDHRVRRPLPPPKRPVQSGPSGEDLFRPTRPVTDGLFEPRPHLDDEDEYDHRAEASPTGANGSAVEHDSLDSPHQDAPDGPRDSSTPHKAAREQAPPPEPTPPHRPTFPPRPAAFTPSTARDDAREPHHETEGQPAPGRFAAQETPGQFATYRAAPHGGDAPGPLDHLSQAAPGQSAPPSFRQADPHDAEQFAHRGPGQAVPSDTQDHSAPAPGGPGLFTPGRQATHDAPEQFAHEGSRQTGSHDAPERSTRRTPGQTAPHGAQGQFTDHGPGPLTPDQAPHDAPEQFANRAPDQTAPNDTQGHFADRAPGQQAPHDTPGQSAHQGRRQASQHDNGSHLADQGPDSGPLGRQASEQSAHQSPRQAGPHNAGGHAADHGPDSGPFASSPGQQASPDAPGQFAHHGPRQAGSHDAEGHADQGHGPGPFIPGQAPNDAQARQGRRQAGQRDTQGHFADAGPGPFTGQQAPHGPPGQFAHQGPRQASAHDTEGHAADHGPGQAPHDAPVQFAHRGPAPNDGPGQSGGQGPGQFGSQQAPGQFGSHQGPGQFGRPEAGGQFVTQAPEHMRPADHGGQPGRRRTPENQQDPSRPEPRKAETPSGLRRPQDWPIQPLSGEPPLTLFRGKQVTELPSGTELDRYGDPTGNLTYAVGTPFDRRSLVPDWINRPYHAYRVARPTEALTGAAIPWFDQPGGGTAYILSHSVADLLESGHLVEIPDRTPPPRA